MNKRFSDVIVFILKCKREILKNASTGLTLYGEWFCMNDVGF